MQSGKRRAMWSAILAVLISMSGVATAQDTVTDTTLLELRTQAGNVEKLKVENLPVGQTRSLSTEAGNLAIVTNGEAGMKVELAGEVFDIPMKTEVLTDEAMDLIVEHAAQSAESGGDGKIHKKVIVTTDSEDDGTQKSENQKKIVIIKAPHGADQQALIDAEMAEALADADANSGMTAGENQRIKVIRKLEVRKSAVTQ